MIQATVGFITLVIYSFYIALSKEIYWTDFLPILFLFLITRKIPLKQLFTLNIFVGIVFITTYFENPELAFLILIRSNIIFLFVLMLFYKKDFFIIIEALTALQIPKKLIMLVFFYIKSVEYLFDEFKKIKRSLYARGFVPKTNIFTYKTYANAVGLLIMKAFSKSNKIQKTIIIRNFDGNLYLQNSFKLDILNCIFIFSVLFSMTINFGKLL